jgi:hypothetical protein
VSLENPTQQPTPQERNKWPAQCAREIKGDRVTAYLLQEFWGIRWSCPPISPQVIEPFRSAIAYLDSANFMSLSLLKGAWSFYISGARWMILQPKPLLWMLCFGFVSRLPQVATSVYALGIRVSGHDFSRAVQGNPGQPRDLRFAQAASDVKAN